jgi:hypothetical protein
VQWSRVEAGPLLIALLSVIPLNGTFWGITDNSYHEDRYHIARIIGPLNSKYTSIACVCQVHDASVVQVA